MALMVAGFAILGIPVGPSMLDNHGHIAALIGWSVFWSNLAAVASFLLILPMVGKIVYLRIDYLAPVVLTIAVAGALIEQIGWVPLVTLFVISAVGCFFVNAEWPRAPFLLAFVMGRMAEINLVKTSALYGWDMFARWQTLLLLAALLYLIVRGLRARKTQLARALNRADIMVAGLLIMVFVAAGVDALSFAEEARLLPLLACGVGVAATGTLILAHLRARGADAPAEPHMPWRLIGGFALFLVAVLLFGILPASAFYVCGHAFSELRLRLWRAVALAGAVASTVWLLFGYWLRLPLSSGVLW
jgi:TctA family transporter